MKRIICASLALTVIGCAQLPTQLADARPPLAIGTGYLVGTPDELALPDGWDQQSVMPAMRFVQPPASIGPEAMLTLRALPGVRFVEPNRRLSLVRPLSPASWSVQATTAPAEPAVAWNMSLATFNQAWKLLHIPKPVKVAVIDSGVDGTHPDLVQNTLAEIDVWKEVHGTDRFRYGTRIYVTDGKDGNGHGTHVAGILAASAGAGSGGTVQILPIKATDYRGETDALTLYRGIQRALTEGCKVINMSIGGPQKIADEDPDVELLRTAVAEAFAKGVLIVAATGNQGAQSRRQVSPVDLPAAFPGTIAVAAVTQFDKVATYSNGGPEVDVAAPGGAGNAREGAKIRSTLPTYPAFMTLSEKITDTYGNLQGTSMAAPHVAGLAALLLAQEPTLTPSQICRRISLTCDDIGAPGWDQDTGFGRINAYRALSERVE